MSEFREWFALGTGILGGLIGFGFGSYGEIRDFFFPSHVEILANPTDLPVDAVLSDFPARKIEVKSDGIQTVPETSVPPGLFVLEFFWDDKIIKTQYINVEPGNRIEINFPTSSEISQSIGNTYFDVNVAKRDFAPGEFIPLEVLSISTGYLWVYESYQKGSPKLIFPPTSGAHDNLLAAGKK